MVFFLKYLRLPSTYGFVITYLQADHNMQIVMFMSVLFSIKYCFILLLRMSAETNQPISDILLFHEHLDPQLQGMVAQVLGNLIHAGVHSQAILGDTYQRGQLELLGFSNCSIIRFLLELFACWSFLFLLKFSALLNMILRLLLCFICIRTIKIFVSIIIN